MPKTASGDKLEEMKALLDQIAKAYPPSKLSQAARDMLAAVEYDDEVLFQSSENSLFDAMCELAPKIISREVGVAAAMKKELQDGWDKIVDGVACEDFTELRKVLESAISEQIGRLGKLRDELVRKLQEKEYSVENADQLDDCIMGLESWREGMLQNWPSPSKRPAPLDRQAIQEARAAIARGEQKGLRREDLIWGKTPSRKNG